MKLRNVLMTAVFLLAIGASFTTKSKSKFALKSTINIGSATTPICWIVNDLNGCETYYTGPVCTTYWVGVLKPMFEYPIPAGPICVTPLRQEQ